MLKTYPISRQHQRDARSSSRQVIRRDDKALQFHVEQPINAIFRYGTHYQRTTRYGEPAWAIDLYQRRAVVTGFAVASDVSSFPAPDALVRIEGEVIRTGELPAIWVRSLESVSTLGQDVCIFDTALPHWISDQATVDRARDLWASLPAEERTFLNHVFIDPSVLRRFLAVPGSCRHHHCHEGGCLAHSVEVAELSAELATRYELDRDLLVTAALVHDSGKAMEYVRCRETGRWLMSRFGKQVGHKIGSIQLATLAMSRCPNMPARRKESLLHLLSCSYAPSWAGFRAPATREAELLAAADRASAQAGQMLRRA